MIQSVFLCKIPIHKSILKLKFFLFEKHLCSILNKHLTYYIFIVIVIIKVSDSFFALYCYIVVSKEWIFMHKKPSKYSFKNNIILYVTKYAIKI